MKYPPKHHQDSNKDHLIEVIKEFPLATVISVNDGRPLITHLPLIYSDEKLIGHIDIFNPQTELLQDNRDVSVIFQGPQCYISPAVYSTTQLPTWNYIKVHITGKCKRIKNKELLKSSLIKLTEFMEGSEPRYILAPDNPRMIHNLDYIEMFEIEITTWEGKFKLSQDKKKSDMESAKNELIKHNERNLQHFIDKIT